jgi:hypothetical protein
VDILTGILAALAVDWVYGGASEKLQADWQFGRMPGGLGTTMSPDPSTSVCDIQSPAP